MRHTSSCVGCACLLACLLVAPVAGCGDDPVILGGDTFECICECNMCLLDDPPGICTGLESERATLVCADQEDPDEVEEACDRGCDKAEATGFGFCYGSDCGIIPFTYRLDDCEAFGDGRLVDPNECRLDSPVVMDIENDEGFDIIVDPEVSRLRVRIGDDEGSEEIEGTFRLAGALCPGEDCGLFIQSAIFEADGPFEVNGTEFEDVRVIQNELAFPNGRVVPDGTFSFPDNYGRFAASGKIDGDFNSAARRARSLDGSVDLDERRIAMDGEARFGDEVRFSWHLEGTFDEAPPSPLIDAPRDGSFLDVECNVPVLLDASASFDPDGDEIVLIEWYEYFNMPGQRFLGDELVIAPTFDIVPSPIHTALLLLTTDDDVRNHSFVNIRAEDTLPPVFADAPDPVVCLWPPNHDLVLIDLEEIIGEVVTDVCDPAPEGLITEARSSQPDDGLGDGHTTEDVTIIEDLAFCARSERAGIDLEPRRYEVDLRATDDSGNTSRTTMAVIVVHDQRQPRECTVTLRATPAADADEVCNGPAVRAEAGGDDGVTPRRPAGGGCASAPGAPRLWLGALLVLALTSRLRRR